MDRQDNFVTVYMSIIWQIKVFLKTSGTGMYTDDCAKVETHVLPVYWKFNENLDESM